MKNFTTWLRTLSDYLLVVFAGPFEYHDVDGYGPHDNLR